MPGDKSISHRALMLLGISRGTATVQNLSSGQDVLSTLNCMRTLGCRIEPINETEYKITGVSTLSVPDKPLDCGNSGTTIRLLSGLLAGAGITAELTGDKSLRKRPMQRILDPLHAMGTSIEAIGDKGSAPLKTAPHQGLKSLSYQLPMASAQVKSAVLLGGLSAPHETKIVIEEPSPSRDHTERMLNTLGAKVSTKENRIELQGRQPDLQAKDLFIPGDLSSAAFWLVGAAILPGSKVTINHVGLNPLRTGLLTLLQNVGANLEIASETKSGEEPLGDLTLKAGMLQGNLTITPDRVPGLIDEIPILTILGLWTDGTFSVQGAKELRFKESDRLQALINLLRTLRIKVTESEDGFSFTGDPDWKVPEITTPFKTHHDHRLVMALEILNLKATTPIPIEGKEWAAVSYPNFHRTLQNLIRKSSG